MKADEDKRMTFPDRFDYYETEPTATSWEIIFYIVQSIIFGLGLVFLAFLVGYLTVA